MNRNKITSFIDLYAWQEGHTLVLLIYKLTDKFPRSETYGLIDQMRRCVISITSNIAEGFARKNRKEKNQFYYISLGSVTELQNQLYVAKDLKYISESVFYTIILQTITVHKLVNGLIKSSIDHT